MENTRVILTEEMPGPNGDIPAGTFGSLTLDEPIDLGEMGYLLWVEFDNGSVQAVNVIFLEYV